MQDLYSKLGASLNKEDVHAAIQNLDKGIAPGAFCKVLPDILGQNPKMVNVMHADGAGTKSILAYLYWRQTGDLSIWKSIAQDALVMNLDDILCVGASSDFIVTSTIGRNKRLIPAEVIKAIIEGTEEICQNLRENGVPIYFGGGETADVGDLVKTVIVDSNITCRFPKSDLISCNQIKPGNQIIGLASYGHSSYETSYNSGIASNGITLARHVLLNQNYGLDFPESIDSYFEDKGGYKGNYNLTDQVLKNHKDLGTGLLSPTRSFAPFFAELWKLIPRDKISGIIHNTGGAHSKALKFVKNVEINKVVNWEVPEVFNLLKNEADLDWPELFQTFNSGIRIEIFCGDTDIKSIIDLAKSFQIEAFKIGFVKEFKGERVNFSKSNQTWSYQNPL
jgi:phosphoribosylformylglycinamidine cyclo-ligase